MKSLLFSLALLALTALPAVAAEDHLALKARSRTRVAGDDGGWQAVERRLEWVPRRTAIIVCDMWDRHWCRGATERVAEMAPRMNEVLRVARARGVLIIHAPSDTMGFYADAPQRRRAQAAPKAAAPVGVNLWRSLNREKEGPLPIDDADGGCNEDPQCTQGKAWQRQIATLEIAAADVISDSGEEIYNVLQQAGIENVIVLGVHTNMCVLGRPFSIRAMVGLGKNVVLMRDLTDTMYNSRRRPFVSHFVGTDLVVEHIEKYWCGSVTSADLLGGEPFRFVADHRPRVVLLIGEDEYLTAQTLPRFAARELTWRGLEPVVVVEDPTGKDRFPGLGAALREADLVLVSTRRRPLPAGDLRALRAHLEAGRPLVGIRTASHAFAVREPDRGRLAGEGLADWPEFDPEVLGGNYRGHYGPGPVTALSAAAGAPGHVILRGVGLGGFSGHGSLYRSGPLRPGAEPLVMGAIPGQAAEPEAWTHRFGPCQARVFYTSLGHPQDFEEPDFCRLLRNGILWTLDLPVPPAE
jgi:nicotinamidase-related amidase